jgi:protein-tyrosine phosphatase
MATDALPPARSGDGYRIAVVCLGNICRSPMADVVLAERVADAGLADRVRVESFGTGGWHVGRPMDHRAAATLTGEGYDATRHRARQVGRGDLDEVDLVLAMDHANEADLRDLGVDPDRLRMFRTFDAEAAARHDDEVPDPYYDDDGFAEVLTMVERTSAGLVDALAARLAPSATGPGGPGPA